jgi:hypothetical protein
LPRGKGRKPEAMTTEQQRIDRLERDIARLKTELRCANEQLAQLKILNESHTMEIRQLQEKKVIRKC